MLVNLPMRYFVKIARGRCAIISLVLCVATALTLVHNAWKKNDVPRENVTQKRWVRNFKEENVDFLRSIACKLLEVSRKIKLEVANTNPVIVHEIEDIASELDPRFGLSTGRLDQDSLEDNQKSKEVKNDTFSSLETTTVKLGSRKREKKQATEKLITILILNHIKADEKLTNFIVKNIREFNSNLSIITSSYIKSSVNSDKTENIPITLPPGRILNSMVRKVKTPYVLVARDLFYFGSMSQYERLLVVISSTPLVEIAGGAYRNESGFWKVGCLLSNIKKFSLRYKTGYQYSASGCMFCDHLEGPFVAKTSVLKRIPFKANFQDIVLFEDWFLRVKSNRILVMNCPDVMYFKRGPVESFVNERDLKEYLPWSQLAREWQVEKLHYPSRISRTFTCQELEIRCDSKSQQENFLIPTCCIRHTTLTLKTFENFTDDRGLSYEIDSGTLLGAVKLRSILPWNKDAHLTFYIPEFPIYFDNINYFRFKKLRLKYINDNTSVIISSGTSVYMHGSNKITSQLLSGRIWDPPTLVRINDIWVKGKWNPGLYVRNMYGPDYLKHTNISVPEKHCNDRSHHACLEHYPIEGIDGLLADT